MGNYLFWWRKYPEPSSNCNFSLKFLDCLAENKGALFELKKDPNSTDETLEFKFIEKSQVSHDTFIYTYEIPNNMTLGLNLGQHIAIDALIKTQENPDGERVSRKYTPVSWIFEEGKFKLLIKVYYKNVLPQFPEGGKMTQYLNDLPIGNSIQVRGPFGKITFLGNGRFKILKKLKPLTVSEMSVKHVGMLAGGSGITPMFQILQAAHKNSDATNFSIIFGNKTSNDILMKDELDEIYKSKNFNLNLNYLIDKHEEGWEGLVGYVNKDMIAKHLPAPGDDTILLICGPPIMCQKSKEILMDLGYNKESLFEF